MDRGLPDKVGGHREDLWSLGVCAGARGRKPLRRAPLS